MRMSDSSAGKVEETAEQNDQRASVSDIHRSTAAILQQMTRVTGASAAGIAAAIPKASFCAGDQTARKAPKKTTTTVTAALPEKRSGVKPAAKAREETNRPETFLSVEDLYVLQEACEIAGIPVDSPDLGDEANTEVEEGLRRALVLHRAEGGLGFAPEQAQGFLRKLVSDRAALVRLGREAADTEVKLASDEAHAERVLAEAADAVAKEKEAGGDAELLATLMRVKRAKEAALKKAKEEKERKLALEAAAQAALRRMGVCPAGFQWRRQGGGWRCAGGSHFASDGAVAAEMARGRSSSGL